MIQAKQKKEVSCKTMSLFFNALNERKLDENIILQGISYDLDYLKNRKERMEWWVWCKIISNIKPYFSPSEFEEMGRKFITRGTYFEGILWAFFLFTSNKLARIIYKQIFQLADSMFSCIKQQTEFIEKNRIRVTAFWEDGYEFCPEWSFICKGVWEQLGVQIGKKGFKIVMVIAPQKTIFDVSWTVEKFSTRIKRGMLWLFSLKKALKELADSRDEILYHYNRLETSQKTLQNQTTQLKTAYEISTSIRQSLNIEYTLKAITEALIKEAGFSFASVQLFKDLDENDIDIKSQGGEETNLVSPIRLEIVINEKKLGELIVYPNPEMDYRDCNELLEYLSPVINITIHDALILGAVVDYKNNLEQKVTDRTSELQKARDELSDTNKLLKEAQQVQNRFFTNISHEFRTPLTLILGPAKQLSELLKEDRAKEQLDLIRRSAKKLNRLVDELLDISKIESGEMKLKACPQNLVSVVKEITLSFHSLADRKRITFKIICDEDEIIVYIDKDKVDKIFSNVLSNAFKFTPEGGKVEVEIKASPKSSPKERTSKETMDPPWRGMEGAGKGYALNDNFVEICIRDTGIGIPKDQIDKIFDRFYQVDGSHTREHEGTGIGLSLTKELIELHKGRIEVESEEGKGSTFILIFPLGKEHLKTEEICEESLSQTLSKGEGFSEEIISTEESRTVKHEIDLITETEKPLLLIVEDNPDVRKYISMILENHYKIIEAKDGEEGLEKSYDQIPDLIITDVMMPKVDGFQLCRQLKTDLRTSHIPVIMLTAKATVQDKISGLETGADDYIMKPFEAEELQTRIKNLLEQRKRLHEHFNKYGFVDTEPKSITSADQKFLAKVVDIIDENISDTTFGVEVLAEKIAVSHSLLYKKINSLTGTSAAELIKKLRLNKAAELIESNTGNISEIALEVGFNNPSYFAECFHKQFGVAPSQYHSVKRKD